MPPSTVFSYWRRDHRRPSPARGSVSPVGPTTAAAAGGGAAYSPTTAYTTNGPPRLPGLPTTTALNGTFIETQDSPQFEHRPESVVFLGGGGGSGGEDKGLSSTLSSQHSYNNLRVPSASSTDNLAVRPHSSPGNTGRQEETLVSAEPVQASSPSNTNSIQPDVHSQQKSNNGSWRLGFNRNGTNAQAEEHRGARPRKTVGKDLRINTNVDGELGFIGGVTLKEMESSLSGRDHEQQLQSQHEHTSQQKHGKTKRHLLNPMSLLARRRSSQFIGSRVDEGGRNLVPAIPDDYDPRIRGSIVHDFSAPRPRPQLAGRDGSNELAKKSSLPSSAATRHSEHSPVFKEHFEEDGKVLQVENKGFLQSSLLTEAGTGSPDVADLPEFARRLPSSLPEHDENHHQPIEVEKSENEHSETISVTPLPGPSVQATPRSNPRKSMEATGQASSIPIRLKSDASRFSFDMNGVGSSVQERLLEEKHKEKEAARREKAQQERSSFSDYDDDDFDYDAMEDDGAFEERIPGVNADADDMYGDEFQGFSGVVKTSSEQSTFVPMLPTIAASPITPGYSASGMLTGGDVQVDMPAPLNINTSIEDQGIVQNENSAQGTAVGNLTTTIAAAIGQSLPLIEEDEDDMYFDDGDFGELPENEENDKFDESIFDDDTGQLYERQFYPGTKIPVALQGDEPETTESRMRHVPSLASEFRPESWDFRNGPPPSKPTGGAGAGAGNIETAKAPGGVLSEHNLEAFHSALARVADEAAAGNLQRNTSLSENSLGQGSNSHLAESHPGLVSDDNRLSSQHSGFDDEVFDDFNYDDDDGFDDDLIIAEANAEALENDDEGFYGQEFGFYARSNNENCNDEPIYGGYFGVSGAGALNRSHSGGANFREPSLTPITERSEWSTRNSIISLTTHGPAAVQQQQQQPNPGLSQLVDMEYNEEDMTLGALMKLRRGAFGGSNGSLRSTGSLSPQPGPVGASNRGSFLSIPEDSPVDLNPEMGFQQQQHGIMNQPPLSEGQSLPESPTVTLDRLTGGERRSSAGNTA
ncbi:conserved hypothetical protein [Talaromyces stipitatus ATCC 10500]|uniref:Uncharacterized protein n=1 Tax=Talaromyces stipitatus (strain ATCC 10500 / CBS 375.48 / QM 6759 / NRRL 1006) TaxID=441959 RepID=B8LVT8_TALSN|nr:uncharacterized protein TSTA_075900 [Talaromyces stipitatus ATCC 10500]EED24218.1 conserved hypothetical protein [Talaromyces stipitatus ATCC 10500]